MTVDYAPLAWPLGWKRSERCEAARFQTPLRAAASGLIDELRLLGAENVVVTSNGKTGKYSGLLADQKRIADPAVAVYFTLDGEEQAFPCDRWCLLEDNVRAIGLTVAALRGIGRWGAGEMVSAAFRGFAALPEPAGDGWWTVLGVERSATREQIDAAYRARAKETHPDIGGSNEEWLGIVRAYDESRLEIP